MSLGRGVGLDEVMGLSLRSLVGKFSYKEMDCKGIEDWATRVWNPIMDYFPTIYVFQKGWYGFVFKT